jgi:SAM-dependent methyltransferase
MGVRDLAVRHVAGRRGKAAHELAYWRERRRTQGALEEGNGHYRWLFAEHFGLPPDFHVGKRMLDVGCGPRGSLEWATGAAERVGLDPLADEYQRLQSREHEMTYVAGGAESIPFGDGHFDVLSSFNSLDHVDDLERAIGELCRVTRPGGLLLLLTDVNHAPTPTEPQSFGWDILDLVLAGGFSLIDRRDYEHRDSNMLHNLHGGLPYDHARQDGRMGVLSASCRRDAPRV